MVMQSITRQAQGDLRRNGYRLETTSGWDTHTIPLYTHKAVNDKEPGDVGMTVRVGNLKHLVQSEAQYIARKAAVGFFMWPPGECFDHEFVTYTYEPIPGGGMRSVRGDDAKQGCKWCRANNKSGLQGEVEQLSSPSPGDRRTAESAVQPAGSTPPATRQGVKCTMCDAVMKAVDTSGRPRSEKQQLHSLKLHTKKHAD